MLPETIAAVLRTFNRHKIRFLFFGLEALNTYASSPAESYTTKDCDFLIRTGRETVHTVHTVIRLLKAVRWPEPVQIMFAGGPGGGSVTIFDGKKWKNLHEVSRSGTVSVYTPNEFYHIDLAFGDPSIPFDLLQKRSNPATLFGVKIRVACKEDLLELKRLAGREKDKIILERMGYLKPGGKGAIRR